MTPPGSRFLVSAEDELNDGTTSKPPHSILGDRGAFHLTCAGDARLERSLFNIAAIIRLARALDPHISYVRRVPGEVIGLRRINAERGEEWAAHAHQTRLVHRSQILPPRHVPHVNEGRRGFRYAPPRIKTVSNCAAYVLHHTSSHYRGLRRRRNMPQTNRKARADKARDKAARRQVRL